jgi:hypothetical protein
MLNKEDVCVFLKETLALVAILAHFSRYKFRFEARTFKTKSCGPPFSANSDSHLREQGACGY